MKVNDLDQSVVQATKRARAENIKEKIQQLSEETNRQASERQKEQRLSTLANEVGGNSRVAQQRLERILKGDDLTDISYLALGFLRARAVCRVVICCSTVEEGYGTGFLVAPGILMTNHHVLKTRDYVRDSYVQFNYERDRQGNITPTRFRLRLSPEPILYQDFDMAIAMVESQSVDGKPIEEYGWLKLNPEPGKAFIGEYLTAIQHPRGEPKQVCVRENKLIKYSDDWPYVWYETDTDSGSSGSPVFNNSWDVVALHHSSVANTNDKGEMLTWDGKVVDGHTDSEQVAWIANEGVRISRIMSYLLSLDQNELARLVLNAPDPPYGELPSLMAAASSTSIQSPVNQMSPVRAQLDGEGSARIVVPVEITVKVDIGSLQSAVSISQPSPVLPAARVEDAALSPVKDPMQLTETGEYESVDIDQANYSARNGYNPKFLGEDFVVPLPVVTPTAIRNFGPVARLKTSTETELKYWNYSVKMSERRRLAYFSALNMVRSDETGRKNKTWIKDPRLEEGAQLGNEFYEDQPDNFEEFRRFNNPYDKGHLTSYNDMQWATEEEVRRRKDQFTEQDRKQVLKENGDDTFHYTNCAPQHWKFNENELWRRLEVAAITQLSQHAADPRLILINGPVFDAPSPLRTQDGKLSDLRRRDGTMRIKGSNGQAGVDIQVPGMFFKVIAYVGKSRNDPAKTELRAKAFVVTQENLLASETARYHADPNTYKLEDFSAQEIKLYQVSLTDLQTLTGLDFGSLCQSDWIGKAEEAFPASGMAPVEITDASQVAF